MTFEEIKNKQHPHPLLHALLLMYDRDPNMPIIDYVDEEFLALGFDFRNRNLTPADIEELSACGIEDMEGEYIYVLPE